MQEQILRPVAAAQVRLEDLEHHLSSAFDTSSTVISIISISRNPIFSE